MPGQVLQQRDFQNSDAALGNTRPPLVVEGTDSNLSVRLVQDAGRSVTLMLSEQGRFMTPLPRFRPMSNLSARQNEVLKWMVEGKRNGEIGSILHISERTVEKHVAEILASLQVENRATAIVRAMEFSTAVNRAMSGI
jgi:DNA-binding NarL/FixJ family response regulator